MPRNPESEFRKEQIVSQLQSRLGPLDRIYPGRHDWYSSKDRQIDIFITDSKAHHDKRPWFDMKADDIKELAKRPAGFIIFVLGDAGNYLVVPAKDLNGELDHYVAGQRHIEKGFYHFNLRIGGKTFDQLPNGNLHPYKENVGLIRAVKQ